MSRNLPYTTTVADVADRRGAASSAAVRLAQRPRGPDRRRVAEARGGPAGSCRGAGPRAPPPQQYRLNTAGARPERGGQAAPGDRGGRGRVDRWRYPLGIPPVHAPCLRALNVTDVRAAATGVVRGPPPPRQGACPRGTPETGGMLGQRPLAAGAQRCVAAPLPDAQRSCAWRRCATTRGGAAIQNRWGGSLGPCGQRAGAGSERSLPRAHEARHRRCTSEREVRGTARRAVDA
jgi:hypothetical protein